MMELGLLGPLLVQRDRTPVAITAPKQRAILAALLLQVGVVMHADRLIDIVWQGLPPREARASLHTYVLRLRRTLGDQDASWLRTSGSGYVMDLTGGTLDTERFATLRSSARGGRRGPLG